MAHSYKILIVDDNESVRKTLAGVFADAGYLVRTAGDEEGAIKALNSEYFHFIIIDIRLQGNDDNDESGVELTGIIRGKNIDSQIIFITGKAVRGQHLTFAKEYNVLAYIEKTDNWVENVLETIDIFSSPELIAYHRNREDAQIFLSYAREDQEKVEEIYEKLLAAGFKPWMDTKDILPGEDWEIAIKKAAKNSKFFIACLSHNSVTKRGFLQKEFTIALAIKEEKLEDDIYLIPLRLEICDVPERFGSIQWVDLFDDSGWVKLLKAIRVGIERLSIT